VVCTLGTILVVMVVSGLDQLSVERL